MNNILDKDNNVIKKYCKNCKILKTIDSYYKWELKCKECKYLYQKEKTESTKQLIKNLQDKLNKTQDINNMLIENNIKKDIEIKTLRDENEKLKMANKRKGTVFLNDLDHN